MARVGVSKGYQKNINKGLILFAVGIAAFMAMMLSNPDLYLDSARRGLALYATSVLPSLFPFYFCSLLLTNIGAAKAISSIFGKPISSLYGVPKESAYILLMSMLSGYPVGASMTAELYESGALTKEDALAISSFASTSGPIFMIGTIGSAIFGDVRVGVVVLAAHYLAALLNGVIFRIRRKSKLNLSRLFGRKSHDKSQNPSAKRDTGSNLDDKTALDDKTELPLRSTVGDFDDLLAKTISSATLNMLYVGGYIVLCGMLVDTLPLLGIDRLLMRAFDVDVARPILALLDGLIEMTRGSVAAAECSSSILATALCAGIVSFGGLSVTLQNYTFLSRCHIKFWQILVRKACHAALAAGIACLLALLIL